MTSQDAVLKLGALSQESRLEIFRLLVRQGEEGLCAGEIAERMKIQPNTLSFHLKELTSSGLIQSKRQGRSIIYSLEVDGMRDLIQFLTEDCCQGRPELCAPDNNCC
ncbi:ArsR/SmtB family transcription factor [Rubritalea spongiae]|uniref:ArsR/SmtB family transcription factor n=1 Tax=Rubritalea spongiae TaxID=430797 RepID=A0ABW5E471_9BACT